MNINELKKVKFKVGCHVNMEHEHITRYINEDSKIGFSVHEPFKNGEPYGRSYRRYWLDGKLFKSRKKFLEAIENYNPNI